MGIAKLIKHFLSFERSKRMSPDALKKQQEKRLRALLRHTYENSPYYRETFTKAGITAENIDGTPIENFPTIDKAELTEHYSEILTVSDKRLSQENLVAYDRGEAVTIPKGYHIVHSSGSTGVPRYFIYNKTEWAIVLAAMFRALLWDVKPRQLLSSWLLPLRAVYIAATGGSFGGLKMVDSVVRVFRGKLGLLDINTPLEDWKQVLQDTDPKFIVGYPSAVKILADLANKAQKPLHPSRVILAGEPLSAPLRAYLESTFQCDIINIYACSESLCLGVEKTREDQMFLFDDLNLIEVIDGKMYLTSLYNYTQPLIRYNISDQLRPLPPKESVCCFSRCEVMQGRTDDVFWFEDEMGREEYLHPLTMEDFCIPGMLDYQLRQTSKRAFQVVVELLEPENESRILAELSKQIRAVLDSHRLDFIQYTVETGTIPFNPITGKKRLAIPLTESQPLKEVLGA